MEIYNKNLFFIFLFWYFVYIPEQILNRFKNLLKFGVYFFSMENIGRTFFSPWKRLSDFYQGPFDFKRYFESVFGNLISRAIGIFLRVFLVLFFIIFEIIAVVLGILALAIWYLIIQAIIFIFYFYGIYS